MAVLWDISTHSPPVHVHACVHHHSLSVPQYLPKLRQMLQNSFKGCSMLSHPTVPHYSETMATASQETMRRLVVSNIPDVVGPHFGVMLADRATCSHVLYTASLTLPNTYVNRSNRASDKMNISQDKLIEHGGHDDGGFSHAHILQFRAAIHAVVTAPRGPGPFRDVL